MTNYNLLHFDIEVSYNIARMVWRTGEQYINHDQLDMSRSGKIICIAYQFDDDKSTREVLHWDKKQNNIKMLKKFISVYRKANGSSGHNHLKFDTRWVNAQCCKYDLKPVPKILMEDTYLMTKASFELPSYKLAYLLEYFDLPRKVKVHSDLWQDVTERNDQSALQKMCDYCLHDVIGQRALYKKILPYCKSNMNKSIYMQDSRVCPDCGTSTLQFQRNRQTTSLGLRAQYVCSSCRKYFTTGENLIKKLTGISQTKFPRGV